MKGLIPKTQMFLKKHSPTILTCVGAAGVIATAVTAVAATPKAMALLKDKESEKGEKLTKLEVVKTAGPVYIPSALICASTLGCIFGANMLNKKHQAALTSAYALLDSSFKEYRNAVKSVYGEEGEQQVIHKIAEQKELEPSDEFGKVAVFDNFSLRTISANLDDIAKAKAEINHLYRTRGYVCVQEFYDRIGVKDIDPNYRYGWSSLDGQYLYNIHAIEINCEPVLGSDGNPIYYHLTMPFEPYEGYFL